MFKYIARTFPQFEESLGLTDEDRANKANETKKIINFRGHKYLGNTRKANMEYKWFSSK